MLPHMGMHLPNQPFFGGNSLCDLPQLILATWKAWCPKFWSLPKVPEILVTTVLGFFLHLFALFSFGLDTAMDESTHIKTTEFHHTP